MNWITVVINGREVSIAFDENSIHIYNAYPIKDDLKMRGYRWNPSDKSWYIAPGDVDTEMEVLKNNLHSHGSPPPPTPPPTPTAAAAAGPPVKSAGEFLPPSREAAKFPQSYSVADLRNRIDRLIRDGIRGNIWVRGIVASDVKNYKWASYLDLKDEDENRNIYFRMEVKKPHLENINRKLADSGVAQWLEKDLPVFCNVEVYLPFRNVVDVRLSLLDILPEYTQAKIRNQRDITLEKLKEEGVLENQKRLIMPAFISRIGLITSGQGTSIADIKAGLHPYGGKYRFFFVDSRMEGANAVDNITRAISFLENNPRIELDAIVIARGGGSEQSLAVFNHLRLCRKVCLAPIPILTAIGHEKDITAIEQCSWLTPTPATPSGIGKYLQNRFVNLQDRLSSAVTQLIHHFTGVHHREMEKIKAFLKNIPARVSSYVRSGEERFFSLTRGLEQSVIFTVRHQQRRIASLSTQLVKKNRHLHLKNKKDTRSMTVLILSRMNVLNRRAIKQVEKTVLKLDFEKRRRANREQGEDIHKKTRMLFSRAEKKISDTQKELEARRQLVQAGDPKHILKKGFTLTLDKENRVIKSLKEFKQKEDATLKFHDGSVDIIKNEKKEEK